MFSGGWRGGGKRVFADEEAIETSDDRWAARRNTACKRVFADEEAIETLSSPDTIELAASGKRVFADEEAIETEKEVAWARPGYRVREYSLMKKRLRRLLRGNANLEALPPSKRVFADEEAIETVDLGERAILHLLGKRVFADEEAIETRIGVLFRRHLLHVREYSLMKKRLRPGLAGGA